MCSQVFTTGRFSNGFRYADDASCIPCCALRLVAIGVLNRSGIGGGLKSIVFDDFSLRELARMSHSYCICTAKMVEYATIFAVENR